MTTAEDWLELILKLQEPVPQYVLCCLPAIAIMGTAPDDGFMMRILWMLRCLGCPFTGLFYFCNIRNNETAMYWLSSDDFTARDEEASVSEKENSIFIGDEEKSISKIIPRPFGIHAMELSLTPVQENIMKECIAEASVLDRLSSLASAYYIVIGSLAGIIRTIGPCADNYWADWPFIPLALVWTFPAIFARIFVGSVVFKDPRRKLERLNNRNKRIFVKALKEYELNGKVAHVMLTALASIVVPWMSVFLAYFTPPIGFFCRSKFLTVLCSIWTFNSIVGYISHVKGEKSVSGNKYMNGWFCSSGAIIAISFLLLSMLNNTPSWWTSLFGNCDSLNECV